MSQPEGVFKYPGTSTGSEEVFVHDKGREGDTTTNVVTNLSDLRFMYSGYNNTAVYLLPHEVMK